MLISILSSTLKGTNYIKFLGQFLWKLKTSLEHLKALWTIGCLDSSIKTKHKCDANVGEGWELQEHKLSCTTYTKQLC
jgi:hypothetical protein